MKAGALNFLTKPFQDEYFLETIRNAITQSTRNEVVAFGDPIIVAPLKERKEDIPLLAKHFVETGWKIKGVDGAAELLGMNPSTLIYRIEKLGLKRPAPDCLAGH